jgi:3-oxoacyl-[acyl-carrier-protein] synthase III
MTKTYLNAAGHYHPEEIIDNSFFDELDIGSDAQWVVDRVGIESRRSVLTKKQMLDMRYGRVTLKELRARNEVPTIASMGKKAWELLVSRMSSAPNVDALICGTSVPDFDIPANANTIAAAIGVECLAFDCNSACSSFVTDIHVARSMIASSTASQVAIFNAERYSLRVNFEDRASCVLFGDGCAAALLQNTSNNGLEVIDTILEAMPSKFDVIKMPDSECFTQKGQAVQKFAITRTMETTKAILEKNGLTPKDVRYFIGHQANLRMVTSAASKLGFESDQHLYNVNQFGNQGAAGAPAVLSQNWDRFESGDLIVLAVVGSGLTWGACLLRKV